MTKLLLTFLDDYTQWCWIATFDDKSSATAVNREFRKPRKQIETLMINDLRTIGSLFASLNDKAERLNRTLKRSPLSSELTPYAHSSPSALQTIFASSKSTAKTRSSTVKAISRYTSNNLKDSLMPIILTPYFSSTKRYIASSKHHVYGTYFYQRLL
jgi:hypothetical protein